MMTLRNAILLAFDLGVFDQTEINANPKDLQRVKNHSATGGQLVKQFLKDKGRFIHRRFLKSAYEAGKRSIKNGE